MRSSGWRRSNLFRLIVKLITVHLFGILIVFGSLLPAFTMLRRANRCFAPHNSLVRTSSQNLFSTNKIRIKLLFFAHSLYLSVSRFSLSYYLLFTFFFFLLHSSLTPSSPPYSILHTFFFYFFTFAFSSFFPFASLIFFSIFIFSPPKIIASSQASVALVYSFISYSISP